MSKMTLDSIREAASKKYGSFVIEFDGFEVELLNPLRLPRERRDALKRSGKSEYGEDADELDVLKDSLRLVCKSDGAADKLFEAVGDDLVVLAEILDNYKDQTDLGNR